MVRELVYLSKRKLRQFDLGWWRDLRARVKATIKPPGIELTVETDVRRSDLAVLDAVIAALERSDRAPVWFTEDVQPGQWVRFEAPMSYTTIGTAIVFLDVDEQSQAYPSGGQVRLMLHGSAVHLVEVIRRREHPSTNSARMPKLTRQFPLRHGPPCSTIFTTSSNMGHD